MNIICIGPMNLFVCLLIKRTRIIILYEQREKKIVYTFGDNRKSCLKILLTRSKALLQENPVNKRDGAAIEPHFKTVHYRSIPLWAELSRAGSAAESADHCPFNLFCWAPFYNLTTNPSHEIQPLLLTLSVCVCVCVIKKDKKVIYECTLLCR